MPKELVRQQVSESGKHFPLGGRAREPTIKTAIKHHIKVGNRQKYDERPYRCWECGNWHVTTRERYRDER